MKALEEYKNWLLKEKLTGFDATYEEAYTTGFNRAVELMEEYLRDKLNERE